MQNNVGILYVSELYGISYNQLNQLLRVMVQLLHLNRIKRTKGETKMKKTIEDKARKMVGDGKTPNRFWVSVSSDYAYIHKDEDGVSCIDYIGDIVKDWEKKYSKGHMIGMYNSFDEALRIAEDYFYIGMKDGLDFTVNRITIEDRLHGEVYESQLVLDIETGKTTTETYESFRKDFGR
jgi:hypothetical protein